MISTDNLKVNVRLFLFFVLLLLPALACNSGTFGRQETNQETVASQPTYTSMEVVDDGADSEEQVRTTVLNADPTEEVPTPTEEPVTPTPPVNRENLSEAIVKIVAQGSFVEPEEGQVLNRAGGGSGFIIDPTGIAVTNNHVVTGAALLKVYLNGETTPRNARVLGVSECSDLAVIDIDGDDFPYLEWYDGEIQVGLDVYAAGFPFGDSEFTLTRGIVSKANASGETSWASVDSVLEHDATINPGSSGGPLVDDNGRVVGINYAYAGTTNQYFAVGRDEALPILEQLRTGEDVTSIGVNGTVLYDDAKEVYGIWVSSVESGSTAERAGMKPGDIISKMEGLVLGVDGTMSSYCDILRSHEPTDEITVQVMRLATKQVLEGVLNREPLEVVYTAEDPTPEPTAEPTPTPPEIGDPQGLKQLRNYFAAISDQSCLAAEPLEGTSASIECNFDSVEVWVLYEKWVSRGQMNAVLDYFVEKYNARERTWHFVEGQTEGRLLSFINSDGMPTLVWSDESELVSGYAVAEPGTLPSMLENWWSEIGSHRR